MRLKMFKNQRGDTIVEVLIAIAVVSSILGTAYAIVSRNSRSFQQVNERTEALKIAESQLESIRSFASGPPTADQVIVFADNTPFCINGGAKTSMSQCVIDSRYNVEVIKPAGDTLYQVDVRWDSLTGGQDQVGLRYRL
jgi:type II secretory pathway pseudopilin PulG